MGRTTRNGSLTSQKARSARLINYARQKSNFTLAPPIAGTKTARPNLLPGTVPAGATRRPRGSILPPLASAYHRRITPGPPGRSVPRTPQRVLARDTGHMVDDTARDRAIYHALKAADEVAAALQTHLIEEHGADPDRAAPQSPATNSLKLLRQARERLGQGLRAVQADHIAESDEISLRNQQPRQRTS